MGFLVTTTGSASPISFSDLGNRTVTHPTTNLNLELEYSIEELRDSPSLQAAISAGHITITDSSGNPIIILAGADDVKVSVSSDDTTPGYLENKVQGTSDRITISTISPGGDEKVGIDIASTYVGQSSITTLGTITTGVWNGTAIANANLANSSITIGSTNIVLGATSTTLSGLTSVTSTGFTGALTGNASTATALQTGRTINGVTFDGTANITVTAAAGTLTGTTLNATVVSSSLTSVGTITSGTWNGTTIAIANGGTSATTANAALNNLLPSQAGNNAKVLSTDGTNSSWILVSVAGVNGGTVTSIDGSGGTTGLTLTGGPITVNGTLTLGGTLAIANGGTGQTTALAAFNTLSPLTTKGDIIVRDTTNNVRVPVGTNGQVLIADSAQASGVRWGNSSDISGQAIRFLDANTGNSETVVNTTTETDFTSNGTNYIMPANTVKTNSLIRFLVYGRFSTKSGSVGTLTIRLKIGATIYATSIISPGSSAVDQGFQFTGQMQFRTIGVSGTVYSHLLCVFDGAQASGSTTFIDSSNGTAAVDTTVSNTIQMSAQWSSADADNSITIEQATFEILN